MAALRRGEDVSRRLDVTPAKFRVIVTRRPKYVYRNRDRVLHAPAPAHLIESGLPTEALLAQIAVAPLAICRHTVDMQATWLSLHGQEQT
jgi:transposase